MKLLLITNIVRSFDPAVTLIILDHEVPSSISGHAVAFSLLRSYPVVCKGWMFVFLPLFRPVLSSKEAPGLLSSKSQGRPVSCISITIVGLE